MRTFTAPLSAAVYRQPLSVSSRPEDRAPIEGKMQMLQWWTEGPTTEALFCRGGGRLALCVCATHRHTTVITLTIQPGWWRRWGVGERVSATDEDGSVKLRLGTLMTVICGPFGLVFPVNVLYSGGLSTFLWLRAGSTRGCSLVMVLFLMYVSCCNCSRIRHGNCRKNAFDFTFWQIFSCFEEISQLLSALNQTLAGYSTVVSREILLVRLCLVNIINIFILKMSSADSGQTSRCWKPTLKTLLDADKNTTRKWVTGSWKCIWSEDECFSVCLALPLCICWPWLECYSTHCVLGEVGVLCFSFSC